MTPFIAWARANFTSTGFAQPHPSGTSKINSPERWGLVTAQSRRQRDSVGIANPNAWASALRQYAKTKSLTSYVNALRDSSRWAPVPGLEAQAEQCTLSLDEGSGEITRLTRLLAGADTSCIGPRCHDYAEEVFVVQGRLHDAKAGRWLTTGDYASRPPGEPHGPFRTDVGCVVLEISGASKPRSKT